MAATTMSSYDRTAELKAFDSTKAGVKGLVDSGITTVPRIFFQPRDTRPIGNTNIPIIDLHGIETDAALRAKVVAEVREASETLGFFQVVNHGVPFRVLEEMMLGVRTFHDLPAEVKREYYTRELRKVRYVSNFDLYTAPAANWRDALTSIMAPEPPAPEDIPLVLREITFEYTNYIRRLGTLLFEILSEALGLDKDHLKEMECDKGTGVAGNYYPPCPEPDLTLGTTKHSDAGFLTILLQDHLGGLQVLNQENWVNVPPLPGALIVNIGDLLQLISNDKFKSVEHRVLANKKGPRVSIASFFVTFLRPSPRLYGPIKELLSKENPPLYKEIHQREFYEHYNSKGLDGQSKLTYFRL